MSGKRENRTHLALLVACGTILRCSASACAEPPPQASSMQSVPEADGPDYNGQDFTRPQTSFETRFLFRSSSGATSRTDRERLLLKATAKIDLPDAWRLGLLAQGSLLEKTTTSLDTPNPDRQSGLGDSVFQAALAHTIDPHWAFGFGARLVTPTAQDGLGSGRWQIMPGAGVR